MSTVAAAGPEVLADHARVVLLNPVAGMNAIVAMRAPTV